MGHDPSVTFQPTCAFSHGNYDSLVLHVSVDSVLILILIQISARLVVNSTSYDDSLHEYQVTCRSSTERVSSS